MQNKETIHTLRYGWFFYLDYNKLKLTRSLQLFQSVQLRSL
jgi:hypothetical protein